MNRKQLLEELKLEQVVVNNNISNEETIKSCVERY